MAGKLDLCNPATLRAVSRRMGLDAKARLGQNFLVDREALDTIVGALAASAADTVVEIGPGIGTLTGELAAAAARVVAIEIDPPCAAATRITQRHCANVEVVEADAMTVDLARLGLPASGWLICGNLPYHLTGRLLSRFFELPSPPLRGVFLVQREVALRLAAKGGDWSLATVAIRSIADVERIGDVRPESFHPAPEVHSSIIRLTPNQSFGTADRELVLQLARSVFQMRRKILRHGVAHALGGDVDAASEVLERAGIDVKSRPGTLDLDGWRTLARVVAARSSGHD